MKILQISAECVPFSKTGGLGDVVGALPGALTRRGHTVVTVTPRYRRVDLDGIGAVDTGVNWSFCLGGVHHSVRYYLLSDGNAHVIFVDNPMFSDREGIYGDSRGSFGDNHQRYALLVRAALEASRRVDLGDGPLGEEVVVHAHDWHAALAPVYLDAHYRPLGLFQNAGTVLTIHNLAHQGRFSGERFSQLDLAPRWFSAPALEWHGDLGFLKAGIALADVVTTVSPTYAHEICTREGGFGLDAMLKHRRSELVGLLNGLDASVWNPSVDPHIAQHYDADHLEGKAVCKAALQASMGLPIDSSVPLVGSVGRLDPQKGVELLIESIPWLVSVGAQVVVLGSAAPNHSHYEEQLRQLEARYPRNVRAWIGYSEAVAHRVEAGSDLFVMPSWFEPCGLNQMYSMAYGAVPVVRQTGGLADTVRSPERAGADATGFSFRSFESAALRDALWQALHFWWDRPEDFEQIRQNGMRRDWSWDRAIVDYERVYEYAMAKRVTG